jgi:hypothetical protein
VDQDTPVSRTPTPSLWERRARHKKSMIQKGKQAESYKTNNDKRNLR